jgi:hypothetical protein
MALFKCALLVSIIMVLCGDIELNPGPGKNCAACGNYQKQTPDKSFFAFPIDQ